MVKQGIAPDFLVKCSPNKNREDNRMTVDLTYNPFTKKKTIIVDGMFHAQPKN